MSGGVAVPGGPPAPGGGVTRAADLQWISGPRLLMSRWQGLRGIAGDGHFVVVIPWLAAVLPASAAAFGLLAGLFRFGYDRVFTESVLLLAVLVLLGAFSSQLGVLAVVGFCLGDAVSSLGEAQGRAQFRSSSSVWFSGPLGDGPLGDLLHHWLPLLITYLLLAAGVILLPRAGRAVVAGIGRRRRVPALPAWALVSALLVVVAWLGTDAWVAGAPTLIRPVFTWGSPGGVPTVEAVRTLQNDGGVVVAAAVAGVLARQLWLGWVMLPGEAQDRLLAAEAGAPVLGDPQRAPRDPGAGREALVAVLTSLLATLAMAGILELAVMWPITFAVLLLIRLTRSGRIPVPGWNAWQRTAARLPAWARLIALWVLSRMAVQALSTNAIGSYTGLAVFVLLSLVVVFVMFPGEPPAEPAAGSPAGPRATPQTGPVTAP